MPRSIRIEPSFTSWRSATRQLLHERIPPSEVVWVQKGAEQDMLPGLLTEDLLATPSAPAVEESAPLSVPRAFIELARHAACHRNPQKWHLLYAVLWRLVSDGPHVHCLDVDDQVGLVKQMDRQVRRDVHKMTAFVRFRRVSGKEPVSAGSGRAGEIKQEDEHYIAWHRPDHFIAKLVTPFFVERFRVMRWSILTPDCSVHWDRNELRFSEGLSRNQAPPEDELEELWRTYYGAVFNPARIKLKAMRAEMPVRYWDTLPETQVIQSLLAEAPERVARMVSLQQQAPSAKSFIPERYFLHPPAPVAPRRAFPEGLLNYVTRQHAVPGATCTDAPPKLSSDVDPAMRG